MGKKFTGTMQIGLKRKRKTGAGRSRGGLTDVLARKPVQSDEGPSHFQSREILPLNYMVGRMPVVCVDWIFGSESDWFGCWCGIIFAVNVIVICALSLSHLF